MIKYMNIYIWLDVEGDWIDPILNVQSILSKEDPEARNYR